LGENKKFLDFRVNTQTPFPESGSEKHFQGRGMRAIDFPHQITPKWVIFSKTLFAIFSNFFDFLNFHKKNPVIFCLCRESIARIAEP
jgi:hypothetical protein